VRVSSSGDDTVLHVEEHEAGLLRELVRETRTLLEADVPREDPVIARLFPDQHQAGTRRSFAEHSLRAALPQVAAAAAGSLGAGGREPAGT